MENGDDPFREILHSIAYKATKDSSFLKIDPCNRSFVKMHCTLFYKIKSLLFIEAINLVNLLLDQTLHKLF